MMGDGDGCGRRGGRGVDRDVSLPDYLVKKLRGNILETPVEFEERVRDVCREIWGPGAGASAMLLGKERDSIFQSREAFYVVEATLSRQVSYVQRKGHSVAELVKQKRKEGQFAKGYIVVREEPTPEQRAAATTISGKANCLEIISYAQLRNMLFEGLSYLALRDKAPFGSISRPGGDEADSEVRRNEFVEGDLLEVDRDKTVDVDGLLTRVEKGERIAITGEFGIGKSMCCRELYYRLSDAYRSGDSDKVPVYLNLREHREQSDPVEILERHARNIGFAERDRLVAAWRAGFVVLIFDGFDEVSSAGWSQLDGQLRAIRSTNLYGIKLLIESTNHLSPIIISGRSGYFDSTKEMSNALGLRGFSIFRALPFTEKQANKLLERRGKTIELPDWMPLRPLLVSYLINRDLLELVAFDYQAAARGPAWRHFIDLICEREAGQIRGMDADSAKRVIGALASTARTFDHFNASFNHDQFSAAFRSAIGRSPIDTDYALLMRFPGLGPSPNGDGTRAFVDQDIASAAAAIDVEEFVASPYDPRFNQEPYCSIQRPLEQVGVEVVSASDDELTEGTLNAALTSANRAGRHQMGYDVLQVIGLIAASVRDSIILEGVYADTLEFRPDSNMAMVHFDGSVFSEIAIPIDVDSSMLPSFSDCYVGRIIGRAGVKDLPEGKFSDCKFEKFLVTSEEEGSHPTDLPRAVQNTLIILRKLYFQAGSARRESAFYRGVDQSSQRLVPNLLQLIEQQGFATKARLRNNTIYAPVRARSGEVREIMQTPNSNHPLLQLVKDIQ